MHIEQIDRYCDLFEQRLKAGEQLSADQFLQEHHLPQDEPLLAELRKLEREYREGACALTVPNPEHADPADLRPVETVGTVIGSYKLLQRIGEGGMGVVYMAEQAEPVVRRVALKIIKPGMDSREVIARFEAERQALAIMDHPNIARVLDAGATATGRPYFVMELVKGVPITRYCDEKHLTPKERLELFIPICQAVQHAHQKGIIHRDLKPSNALVAEYDDRPVPKIIDFGVAKAISQRLTEKTMFTQYGQIVGTIHYMSPEQASFNQLDVDTRSDIYSLGVLLYELLAGETPFDKKRLHAAAFDELLRIIRQEEPPRPSVRLSSSTALPTIAANRRTEPKKLSLLVRGELDWIVMKALEKERARRYETANGLAMDVQRYLADEPVSACPPSATYRLRKLARRHRAAVAMSVAIAFSLLLGLIGTTWQAIRASNEARRADDRAGDALREKERADDNAAEAFAAKTRADARTAETLEQKERADRKTDEALAAKRLSDRHLYIAHMNLAQKAWETGAIAAVQDYLDRWRPTDGQEDLRGFEWHYLDRLCQRDLLTLKGHTGPVFSVAFSPDGRRMASASWDGTVKLWDAATGLETATLQGARGQINCVAFSNDGTRIASAGVDPTIKLWDVATGQEISTLKGHGKSVYCVDFSPDGTRIASGSGDRTVKLWDLATGHETATLKGHTEAVYGVAFSPDGTQITSASGDETVKLWDVATGHETATFKGGVYSFCVAFSPDGTRIASEGREGTVKLWNAATGQETATLKGHTDALYSVAFSPDGTRIASASADGTLKLWDVATGQATATIAGNRSMNFDFAFGPGGIGSYSYSTGSESEPRSQMGGTTSAATGQEIDTTRGHGDSVYCVAFSPDGTRIASANDDCTVKLWEVATSQQPATLKGHACVAFSHDGMRIASASDGTVKLWDVTTGQETATLAGHGGTVLGVDFSPDGRQIAATTWDNTIKIWDVATGSETATLAGHGTFVFGVAFSPDGRQIVSASWDGTAKLWDAATGQETATFKGHAGAINCAAFSPDGTQIATASRDGTVKLWDVARPEDAATLKGHLGPVNGVAFSSDGMRIAWASDDWTVKLWDAATRRETATLSGHRGSVRAVVFSPDVTRIASASVDGTVKLWDAATGEETATLAGYVGLGRCVAFSPDGMRIASAGTRVSIWDARPCTPKLRVEQWAVSLAKFHLSKGLPREQIIDAIAGDATISAEVRQRALELVRRLHERATAPPPDEIKEPIRPSS